MVMEEEDDDFTFPTPAAAEEEASASCQDGLDLLWPLPPAGGHLAGACASSSLWPFSSSPSAALPARETTEAEEAPASTSSGGGGGQETVAVARHDELHERAAAAADEERMDLLWEDFNDELLLQLRRQRAAAVGCPAGTPTPSPGDGRSPPSDEETSMSPGRLHGCAPTMLRASSRAGGVGQFYGRRGGGRCRSSRATGWDLLLRLFRKLFAVDTSPPSQHHRHHHGGSIHVP
ncbi:hypothetical protein GUJ93_ZPchr0006g42667 [Zizania palustris]|uniref:Uncharacterized protein n=1 Tax=Zizania palustris TaxID=103762 RepID=A0A8J5T789_ZIZPA|nr:hypothetical protein GUJ93_ZPchr0006g42667 [Zizania palustris]